MVSVPLLNQEKETFLKIGDKTTDIDLKLRLLTSNKLQKIKINMLTTFEELKEKVGE